MTLTSESRFTPERTRHALERMGIWQRAEGRPGWPDRMVRMPCPIHSGTRDSFVLWPDGGWRCHSECQRGGGVLKLIAEIEAVTHNDAIAWYLGDEASQPATRISTHGITRRVPQAPAAATVSASTRGERPRDMKPALYVYRLLVDLEGGIDNPRVSKKITRQQQAGGGKPDKQPFWQVWTNDDSHKGWQISKKGSELNRRAFGQDEMPERFWYTEALEPYATLEFRPGCDVAVSLATGDRAPADPRLWIAEGEECATLLAEAGLCAITGPDGASSFKRGMPDIMAAFLARWPAGVVVLPDNDKPGAEYAAAVARAAQAAGVPVWVVHLPDLPAKGDVLDWAWESGYLPPEGYGAAATIDAHGIRRGLLEAVSESAPWEPSPETTTQAPAAPAFRIMSCADIAAAKSDAPRHIFGMRDGTPVIGAGVILLGAPPKIGKSWVTLELAYSMATGMPAFGLLYPEGADDSSVIYVNSDRQDAGLVLAHRQAAILDGRPEPENIDWFDADGDAPMPQDEALVAAVLQRVKERGNTRLVVIDTLTAATGPATKRGDLQALELAQVLRWKAVTSHGASVILVKHSPKLIYADVGSNFAGSNGLLAGVDQGLYLERKRDANTAALVVLGGRTGIASSIELEATASGRFIGKQIHHGAPRGSMEDRDKVRELAALHPSGITASLVAAALEKQPNTATQLLVRMTKAGELRSTTRGVYALP